MRFTILVAKYRSARTSRAGSSDVPPEQTSGVQPMAEALLYVCGSCHKSIEAWSDGNPYYLTKRGVKKYAYHPDHDRLAKCIGNDIPYLCLACGTEFILDSEAPVDACPQGKSSEILESFVLEGKMCPFCKAGKFAADPNFHCIS